MERINHKGSPKEGESFVGEYKDIETDIITRQSQLSPISSIQRLDVEILSAPGVRRCAENEEHQPRQGLAEDVAGVTFFSGHLIAYLADGAPGSALGINSRIHARILGQKVFIPWAINTIRSGQMIDNELQFKNDIERRMEHALRENFATTFGIEWPNYFIARKETMQKFDGKPGISWQTSFTGIIYSINTTTLYIYQIGDTVTYYETVYNELELVTNTNPIFTRLYILDNYSKYIQDNKKINPIINISFGFNKYNNISFVFIIKPTIKIINNIKNFAILSDGIFANKRKSQEFLNAARESKQKYKEFQWTELLKNLTEPSYDDKTIIIVKEERI